MRGMKTTVSAALAVAFLALAGCSNVTPAQPALPQAESPASARSAPEGLASGGLTELYNLDYSNGAITVFSIQNGKAKKTARFTPGAGNAQGLAADAHGHIYTTLTESSSRPCPACVQVFNDAGKLVRQLNAPKLQGGSGSPSLTDVSVDARNNVYVSDYGQDAVYFFPRGGTKTGPTVVVQNYHNAASVLSQPNGRNVLVSGGCGFASVAPFKRVGRGQYTQGGCFGIGTIALIGGAADDQEEVMTPVDGIPGLVSVSSPNGGASFRTPGQLASISGVALNGDASIAYVANARSECVYAFARPTGGWLSNRKPKLLATYKGFRNLDIIAVPQ
jgi:hypothetical protein